MAYYTIQLRKLLERTDYQLPLNEYPIFDENYRNVLNKKIVDHYYFREIGAETPGQFNFYLKRLMNEIMPYYNQLYKSKLIEFNPLQTKNVIQSMNSSTHASGFSDGTSASQTSGLNVESDTPQSLVATEDIANTTIYASSGGKQKGDAKSTSRDETQSNAYGNTFTNMSGFDGTTPMELIQKYRDIMIDVDMMIIKDLNELFMNIYEPIL